MINIKDCKSVWNNCLATIRDMVGEQSFKTWFEPIKPLQLSNNVLTIQVPNLFFYEWLEEHYIHVLKRAIDQELGVNGRLEYSINVEKNSPENGKIPVVNLTQGKTAHNQTKATESVNIYRSLIDSKEQPVQVPFDYYLDPKYTFDSFIEGDCNRLARSAARAVADKPGVTSFNPLFIYGKYGLGKTHLIQAIGNQLKKSFPNKAIIYIDATVFANKLVEYIQHNKIQEFLAYFQKMDIFIFDDVQLLTGKEKIQEIFFHIFNHLHQNNKQVVLTSDRAPKDIVGIQERLLSRFKWGLSADLQVPDFETRLAIFKSKIKNDDIKVPENVLEYLAYSIDTNVRDIEGVINKLIALTTFDKRPIDLELAKEIIQSTIQQADTEVGIDFIQKFVGEYFSVTVEQMKDKTRKREIVVARQVAMYFAKEYTNMSLKSIGSHFGNRDHSTVIHALQSVSDLMDTDKKFNSSMQELIKKFKMKNL